MKKFFIFLAAAALLAVGCNKEAASPVRASDGGPVKFSAELKYQFDTRATATAFQNGDEIGIFAGTPIARYNVNGTVGTDGSSVTVDTPINWQAGQTAATTFAAYYPYLAAKTPEAGAASPMLLPWSITPDQRDLAAQDESDLRIAKAENVAVDSPVSLAFSHAFAKIAVFVNSSAVPGTVEKVEVLGTKVAGSVDLVAQTVAVSGDAAAITANHVDASSPYSAIILPQTVAPQIRVTMDSKTTYTFSMDGSAIAFESGKMYSTSIIIPAGDSQLHAVTFSVGAIADWTNDNTSVFFTGDPVVEAGPVWSVIGTINGSNWNIDYPMTQISEGTEAFQGVWEYTISNYAVGQHFKLRFGGKWKFEGGYEAGYPGGDGNLNSDAVEFQLNGEQNENGNIYLNDALAGQNIKITFNANNWKVTITPVS